MLETPFHGMNAHSLIVLAQARGALLAVLAGRGIEWGDATDDKRAYAAISDRFKGPGSVSAVDLKTGEKLWTKMTPDTGCKAGTPGCQTSMSAAISVIPGIVFAGGVDGHFRAYDSATGEIVWDYDAAHPFETVNGVPANEAMNRWMQHQRKYVGYSSERYLKYDAARWFLRQPHRGDKVALELEDVDGRTLAALLTADGRGWYIPRLPVPRPGIGMTLTGKGAMKRTR